MTKSEFISCLAKERNLSIILAEQVFQTVFDSMSEALVSGDRIELRGFGSFCVKEYEGHTCEPAYNSDPGSAPNPDPPQV